jgi:predicted transcriptional regulator
VSSIDKLSKREREITTVVFRLGRATAREVQEELRDGTSNSAVRTFLSNLESKGVLTHRLEGNRYSWIPAADPEREGAALIASATRTFFKGSKARAIAALIGTDDEPLSEEEYGRLREIIEASRKKGG